MTDSFRERLVKEALIDYYRLSATGALTEPS